MFFWLKYLDENTITPEEPNGEPEYMRFDAARLTSDIEANRISSVGARGYLHTHTIYHRASWSIIISADELWQDSKYEFIEMFWKAHRWWICEDESLTQPIDANFIECSIAGGKLPVDYVENHRKLRRVTMEMTAIAPSL